MPVTLGCMNGSISRDLAVLTMLASLMVVLVLVLAAAPAYADGTAPPASEQNSKPLEATYDDTQPGADDPRVKEGFATYQADDFKKAYDIWLPLAEAGNAEAQFRVGRLYRRGEGVPKDIKKAIRYWNAAVQKGHIHSATNLGSLYDGGEGVERDQLRAFELYEIGASQCDPLAQFNLGTLYVRTFTPKRNFTLGYQWLFLAEKFGSQYAAEAIDTLDKYSKKGEKALGHKRMQEWLANHSCN